MASDHAIESLTKNVQNSAGACRILQELRNSSSKKLKKCKFRAKFKLEKAQKMPISRNLGSKKLKKCKFRHKKYNFWLFSRNFRNFAWRGLRAWLEGVAWQKSCKNVEKMANFVGISAKNGPNLKFRGRGSPPGTSGSDFQ